MQPLVISIVSLSVLLGITSSSGEVFDTENGGSHGEASAEESTHEPEEEGGSFLAVSSIEALLLKMVKEQGHKICESQLAKSVMRTAWRRELDNSPDELEQRSQLIQTCSPVNLEINGESNQFIRGSERTLFPPGASEPPAAFDPPDRSSGLPETQTHVFPWTHRIFTDEALPNGKNSGNEVLKSWDAATPKILRKEGISPFLEVPAPTPEELKEINAIMKNKEGECTPRTMPVPLPLDPDPAVHLYPKCVIVKRCGGCCSHEALECAPTPDGVETVTHKVVGMAGTKLFLKRITVEEHNRCKCDCRVKATDCTSKQKYDSKNCKCRCNKVIKCSKPQEFVEKLCLCSCPERLRKDCSSGMYYDTKKCKCVTAAEITGPKVPLIDKLPKKGV